MNEAKGASGINYFGAAFWQIGNAWKRRAISVLRPQNITVVQFLVLKAVAMLRDQKRHISQVDVAETLQANPMVVSSVIRSLKKQKLISVKAHPKDSRAKRVELTTSGIDHLTACHQLIVDMESTFFKPLEGNEKPFSDQLNVLARAHPFTLES